MVVRNFRRRRQREKRLKDNSEGEDSETEEEVIRRGNGEGGRRKDLLRCSPVVRPCGEEGE